MARRFPLALATSLITTALAGPLAAETVKITLLGVGDVYNFTDDHGRGGVGRLNAVGRAERAASPNTI